MGLLITPGIVVESGVTLRTAPPTAYSYLYTAGNASALQILTGQTNMTNDLYSLDPNDYNLPWNYECWFKSIGSTGSTDNNHQTIFSWKSGSNSAIQGQSVFRNAVTGSLECRWNTTYGVPFPSDSPQPAYINFDTWYHFAYTHHYANNLHVYTVYLNGVLYATSSWNNSTFATHQLGTQAQYPLDIGAQWTLNDYAYRPFNGYISNLRMVKNIRVYTGNFTVPVAPLSATQSAGTNISAITGTDYIWPGSGGRTSLLTGQSATFIDTSANNLTITNRTGYSGYAGSVTISTQNPFY